MFDHHWVGSLTDLDSDGIVAQLRSRIDRMQSGRPREVLQVHPALAGVVQVRAGGSYQVDNASLALALMAGPSRAGGWTAVVGDADFGAEAAAEMGIELARTVLVPEPGEQWVEATAALVGVVRMVVLRLPDAVAAAGVSHGAVSRIGARLRKHGSVLVVRGPWPGCDARLSLQEPTWSGIESGYGRLRRRRAVVVVRRGAAPPVRAPWSLPPAGIAGDPGSPAIRPAELREAL